MNGSFKKGWKQFLDATISILLILTRLESYCQSYTHTCTMHKCQNFEQIVMIKSRLQLY